MIKLKLPFWLSGPELTKLVAASQGWWEMAVEWLRWPYLQFDPDTCHLSILELWAWQRDVTRFQGEPEALFRLRVKHAFINSVDAGTHLPGPTPSPADTTGFQKIAGEATLLSTELKHITL